jgi:NAD(P)-dependent dehydrogenase (short-subunit alcohol dehydrogenase family)
MSKQLLTLITGANQGIGYYTARHLARTGKYKVLVASRSLSKASDTIQRILGEDKSISPSVLEAIEINLSYDESISQAAKYIETQYGQLDILINNAAISGSEYSDLEQLRSRYNATYDTNVAGTAVVTEKFLPLLKKSTAPAPGRRIVFVSSELGSLTLAAKGVLNKDYITYSVSKAALDMLALYYVGSLKADNIAVVVTTPGFCETNLNGYAGTRPADDGALEVVAAATEGGFEMSGKFVKGGQIIPW